MQNEAIGTSGAAASSALETPFDMGHSKALSVEDTEPMQNKAVRRGVYHNLQQVKSREIRAMLHRREAAMCIQRKYRTFRKLKRLRTSMKLAILLQRVHVQPESVRRIYIGNCVMFYDTPDAYKLLGEDRDTINQNPTTIDEINISGALVAQGMSVGYNTVSFNYEGDFKDFKQNPQLFVDMLLRHMSLKTGMAIPPNSLIGVVEGSWQFVFSLYDPFVTGFLMSVLMKTIQKLQDDVEVKLTTDGKVELSRRSGNSISRMAFTWRELMSLNLPDLIAERFADVATDVVTGTAQTVLNSTVNQENGVLKTGYLCLVELHFGPVLVQWSLGLLELSGLELLPL